MLHEISLKSCQGVCRVKGSRPENGGFPLQVVGEVLPQVEEFKYLGVFFTSEGKME